MNIPPPILEKNYNQGGDDDADDHEHEDEQDPYTQWRLATYSDGSPFLVYIHCTTDVTKEAGCCLPWSHSPDLFQHPLQGIRDGYYYASANTFSLVQN